jgi:hypothetical protein
MLSADVLKAERPEVETILQRFRINLENLTKALPNIIDFSEHRITEQELIDLNRAINPTAVDVRISHLIEKSGGQASVRRRFRQYVDIRVAITKIIMEEYGDTRTAISSLCRFFAVSRASIYHYNSRSVYPEIKSLINDLTYGQ